MEKEKGKDTSEAKNQEENNEQEHDETTRKRNESKKYSLTQP